MRKRERERKLTSHYPKMTRQLRVSITTNNEIRVDFSYFEKISENILGVSRFFETFLRNRENKERDW